MSKLGSFFKDRELDQVEKSIDGVFDSIRDQQKQFVFSASQHSDNALDGFAEDDDINKILENVSIPPERTLRYQTYEELARTTPFIKRMLRVYHPYILQKNPVSGHSYLIKPVSELDKTIPENPEEFKNAKTQLMNFLQHFKFINLLKQKIIPYTVLYGDTFVETVNKRKEEKKVDLNKIISLNESETSRLEKQVYQYTTGRHYQSRNGKIQNPDQLIEDIGQSLAFVDEQPYDLSQSTETDEDEPLKFDDILIKVHKPHRIIILETDHGTRIGYLEVAKESTMQTHNIAQSLQNIVGRLTQSDVLSQQTTSEKDILDKLVSGLLKKVMRHSNIDDVNRAVRDLNKDVYEFIKNMVIERGQHRQVNKFNQVRVRFIPLKQMEQFSLPLTSDYLPYGTSLLDPIVLPSKLYLLSQLGNIITKLSRAPAIRKWTIDQGTSQMSGQLIQRLKRELNNSRITVEDLNSWKSIPKILSDYKDLYLLEKQGTRSLDVEVTSLGDPSVKVQDLQDARSELIALSGIPAPLKLAA